MANLYISKVKLANGNEYLLKDTEARELISGLSSATHFLGVTTTALTDGAETSTISISGSNHTAVTGDIVIYGSSEFIYNGTSWALFGDLSSLGNLAYKNIADIELTVTPVTDVVLGEATTFTNGTSQVSFASGAGSDFVTGYNNDGVAPSFQEGAFTPASLASGFVSAGSAAQFTEGAFTPAAFQAGFVSNGTAPSFTEGAFTPAEIQTGFVTPGSAASYSHSGFSGGSLGEATTGSFATNGVVAAMGTGEDAETLVFSAASTSSAVTAQGAFTAAVYGTDTFDGGTPTAIDVTKFSGGSKAADTFSAGTMTTVDTSKFSGGSKAADTFVANVPTAVDVTKFDGGSKAADTFNAGSAATLAKSKALTASDTGTAAAQTITVGTNDKVSAVTSATVSAAFKAQS
jgi:hypothetical protein